MSQSALAPISVPSPRSGAAEQKYCGLPKEGAISFGVCVFYGATSLALALLNKALLSAYNFNGYFMLLSAQMFLQLIICVITRDYFGNVLRVPTFDRAIYMPSIKLGVMYVANVAIGLIGLQMVNVPMFFCIRRLVSPTILIYEWLAMGKVADSGIQGAIAAIMAGTIVAGWDTLNSDLLGYALTMGNNLCTAAATVMQKQFSDATKLGATGVLFYNALTAAPLSFALCLLTGEFGALSTFAHASDATFWFNFFIACAMGPLLTYSSMLCTTHNSPLATSVTGNIKDIATTILGAIIFPGFTATAKSVGGLGMTFVGAGMYSYVNLKKAMANRGQGTKPQDSGTMTPGAGLSTPGSGQSVLSGLAGESSVSAISPSAAATGILSAGGGKTGVGGLDAELSALEAELQDLDQELGASTAAAGSGAASTRVGLQVGAFRRSPTQPGGDLSGAAGGSQLSARGERDGLSGSLGAGPRRPSSAPLSSVVTDGGDEGDDEGEKAVLLGTSVGGSGGSKTGKHA